MIGKGGTAFLVLMTVYSTVNVSSLRGYELRTHAEITVRAFERSQNTRKYLEGMQIKPTDIFDFENRTRPSLLANFTNTATPRDWMIEGSIREDDYKPHATCDQPQNPPTNIDRPLNHFFDVQRSGSGLTVFGVNRGYPAPDWALGQQGRSENEFTIIDGRVYQFKSLTESNKDEREKNTAKLFRSLGQVSHLLQDMAQPQHARNDAHAGCFPETLTGEHSWYEDYIEKRAINTPYRGRELFIPRPPSFGDILNRNYTAPKFTTYRDFWTRPDAAGLADFSSRNFFSAGTNLSLFSPVIGNCGGLLSPACNPDSNAYTKTPASFLYRTITGQIIFGDVVLYVSSALDFNTGQNVQVAVSSRSIWDQHLENNFRPPTFTLNTLNYDSMSTALLPRAVGYSEGLLDYFFRGRLKGDLLRVEGLLAVYEEPPYTAQLRLTNDSEEEMRGNFSLYAEKPDGTRTQLAGPPTSAWTRQTLAPGTKRDFFFTVPNGFDIVKQFVVVFQGRLGEEDGAVVGKVVGPAKFLEKWDHGLRGSHPWGHSTETAILNTNPDNGVSTNEVVGGKLVKNNNRAPDQWGRPRFNESYVGPVEPSILTDGVLIRDFLDVLPVPITSQTVIQAKIDAVSINQQPPCQDGFTCAYQYLEFRFSGGRYIQLTIPGQGVQHDGTSGVALGVTPGVPITVKIHEELTRGGISVDNLVLGGITIYQQLAPYFDPALPHPPVLSHWDPDPLPREQHMVVDYIRISDEADTDPNTDPGTDPDSNGDGLPDNGIPPPSVFLVSPALDVTVQEGSVIDISANTSNDSQVASIEFIVDGFSVSVDTLAPFGTDYVVPAGATQLNIQAIATDQFGRTTSASRTISVQPNPPPTVVITSPAAGTTVDEGRAVTFTAETFHNVKVEYFVWTVNGVSDPLLPNPPFVTPYQKAITVPEGALALTVQASATDILGKTGTATRTFVVMPDPRTTVVGRVVGNNGQPITNANITILARFAARSSDNGTFSIPSVSTVSSITATAEAVVGGITLRGVSATLSPVRGGTTNLGDIVVNAPQRSLYGGAGFSVDFNPVSVAVADLNGDGILDIVSANSSFFSNTVSVLLGNGDGTFAPKTDFPASLGPSAVVIADLNGDNVPDIVTAGGGVTVLLGVGDGSFQDLQSFDIGRTSSVALADVNGDLIPDMIAANESFDSVSVLLGNGNGTFQAERRFSVGSQPRYVAVTDLDGNGVLDIVTANFMSNDVSVLLGNGNGTFQMEHRFTVGTGPTSIAVADVQNDGVADLIVANGGATDFNDVSVLLGVGNGAFPSERRFPVGERPEMLVVADINNDGFGDIITANVGSGDFSVLLGGGDGNFQTPQRFITGAEPNGGLAVADLDRDGKLDVVTTLTSSVSLAFGNGDGSFMTRRNFTAGDSPESVATADFNGDGKLDLVTANSNSNDVSMLLGNGDGIFQANQNFAAGDSPKSIAAADVNGDGVRDLVVANSGSGDISVLLGNGDGTFQPQQRYAVGDFPQSVAIADVNGDGFRDLVVANLDPGDVSVLLGIGNGTFQPQQRFAAIGFPHSVTVVDLNADGFPDIVTVGGSREVAVLLGNGDGTFQDPLVFTARFEPDSVAVADLNGDGIPDLAVANRESSEVSVLLGNGDGTFQPQLRLPNVSGAYALAVADVNGDNFLDIVTGTNFYVVTVFLGAGDGTFADPQLFAAGRQSTSVQLVDVNGDGKPDIVFTDRLTNSVSVLLHR